MFFFLGEYLEGIDTIISTKFTKIHAMIYQDKTLSIQYEYIALSHQKPYTFERGQLKTVTNKQAKVW